MSRFTGKRRPVYPKKPLHKVTVELENGELFKINVYEMSPETIEWILYDTKRLCERIQKAAETARSFVDAIGNK